MGSSPGTSGSLLSSFLSPVPRDQHVLLLLRFCRRSATRSLWELIHLHDPRFAEKDVDLVGAGGSPNQIPLTPSALACFLGKDWGLRCHWQEAAVYPSACLRAKPCTWTQRCRGAGGEMAVLAQGTLQSPGTACQNYSGYWCSDGRKWSSQCQALAPSSPSHRHLCPPPPWGSACHSLPAGLGFREECGCVGGEAGLLSDWVHWGLLFQGHSSGDAGESGSSPCTSTEPWLSVLGFTDPYPQLSLHASALGCLPITHCSGDHRFQIHAVSGS